MKSMSIAAAAALAATTVFAQSPTTGVEQPTQVPQLNVPTVQGCFSSSGTLVFNSTPQYNTIGACAQTICQAMGKAVGATTGGNQCWCGDEYPPMGSLADDSKCNVGCAGFNPQACGGINYWTVYNTGLNLSVPYSGSSSSSAASGSSSTATVSGSVVIITQTSTAAAGSSSGGTNTAGIAAGVVIGVLVVAGAVGGLFFWMRRRRNAEIEEEHRRNATVNAFIGGQKPPSSSGGFSVSDSRLDPVMAQRRLSSGSIADNQDYSRKILRVTNA